MGVRSAKDAIREARLKAGLTQEQLAEGICSLQALSRIETGVSGVSPATFQALMERAGAPCERYPVFASRGDFDCFYALKLARFHLDAWQLAPAYEELQKAEDRSWADNRLYYQEWLLLHCRLQFRSYQCDHQLNYNTLLDALRITIPKIELSDFKKCLLTQNEVQLLISIAQEALYLGQTDTCLQIHSQIETYLDSSKFTDREKNRMLAEDAIVYTKYLLAVGNYREALQTADNWRHQMVVSMVEPLLFELTFLTGLCCHHLGDQNKAHECIKAAFYSSYAVKSCYANACRNHLANSTDYQMNDYMRSLPDIPMERYQTRQVMDMSGFSNGVFSADSPDAYTLGLLIRDMRLSQNLSQQILCQGLCSKSTLSKIENGTHQPDISLTECLLQRLGISERLFTFWGNEKEARLYELKFKLIHRHLLSDEEVMQYLSEMESLLDEKDLLWHQTYLLLKVTACPSAQGDINTYLETLHCTLPDFDIHRLHQYRLSWCEITCLNGLAHEYRLTRDSHLCSFFYAQLFEYAARVHPDIQMYTHTFSSSMYVYCHCLYAQKHYEEIISLPERIDLTVMRYAPHAYAGYLFYYSQALGECSILEEAHRTGIFACGLNVITEYYKNADALKRYLYEDFSILLDY
ncbi:MAG: helix-turn-helix domain-containing protein [Acetatifactor sp.]|nr:helix-turn-helix domain-containing protein [Acetatifactor sp.]